MAAVQLTNEQFTQLLQQLQGAGGVTANTGGNGGNTDSTSKSVKPIRPSVDVDSTEGEWAIFDDEWSLYKRMAKLTAIDDIRDNLRQCCSVQLNKILFDLKGAATLNAASEDELLLWIKETAVKGVHMEVHRNTFVQLRQKQGESITKYLGRLKAEASLREFRQSAPASCSL